VNGWLNFYIKLNKMMNLTLKFKERNIQFSLFLSIKEAFTLSQMIAEIKIKV